MALFVSRYLALKNTGNIMQNILVKPVKIKIYAYPVSFE